MLMVYERAGAWRAVALSDREGMDALEWAVRSRCASAAPALRALARGAGHPGWLVVLEDLAGEVGEAELGWWRAAVEACGGEAPEDPSSLSLSHFARRDERERGRLWRQMRRSSLKWFWQRRSIHRGSIHPDERSA